MKRLICLLLCFLCIWQPVVSASCETYEMIEYKLETALRNGQNHSGNTAVMLENAWENGYDYCNVSLADDLNSYIVEVAVRGLVSTLRELERNSSTAGTGQLLQAREQLQRQCLNVSDMLAADHPNGITLSFILLDDERVLKNEYAQGAYVAAFTAVDSRIIGISSVFECWNTSAGYSADALFSGEVLQKPSPSFVLNISSMKFHIPTCDGVGKTKEKNRKEFYGSREEALSMGYQPCGSCNP